MGAWIEINLLPSSNDPTPVAPYMGAWIEIIYMFVCACLA